MEYKEINNIKYPQNLSPEKQAIVDMLARNYAQEVAGIDEEKNRNLNKLRTGAAIEIASAAIPGTAGAKLAGSTVKALAPFISKKIASEIGTGLVGGGLSGAVFGSGRGLMEDKNPVETAAYDSLIGAALGGTIGMIPYVSKTKAGQAIINSKAGQAVSKAVDNAAGKFAQTKAYDALMSEFAPIKNFNKQTMYHGSPYDFEKFSNEAIGTGEGAQAHGMGHYAALDKDVAEGYRNKLSTTTLEENLIKQYGKEKVINDLQNNLNDSLQELQALQKAKLEQAKVKDFGRRKPIDYDNSIKLVKEEINNLQNRIYNINNPRVSGQLYKLSVPKDDVMLREDALMSNQPNMSNLWDEIRLDRVNKSTTSLPKFKMALGANDIDIDKIFNTKYFNDALEMVKNNPEKYKDLFLKDMTGKELYGYLESVLGSRKAATEYLQQRGIKGISYNGGIDGEARVIFNPDDIDIVRKFYNQPEAIEYLNKLKPLSGAIADAFNAFISNEARKQWKKYAKDNLRGKSVDIPDYTTVNFTNKNIGEE
jgi:hypothetical protein